jgi:hypothetical protein
MMAKPDTKTFFRASDITRKTSLRDLYRPIHDNTFDDLIAKLDQIDLKK